VARLAGPAAFLVLAACGALAVSLTGGPAQAAFPGTNGRIVFASERDGAGVSFEIYSMNPDGSDQRRLTTVFGSDRQAAWSADGSKIAFISDRKAEFDVGPTSIFVMNADGTGQVKLPGTEGDDSPAWSPDGAKFAFRTFRDGNGEIYVMNADGSGQVNRTNNASADNDPAWSPDGSKIAFTSFRDGVNGGEIYVMNADGTNPVRLTNNAFAEGQPAWSPDGIKIAFTSLRDINSEIYAMNADGTNQVRLTTSPKADEDPAWSPDGQKIAFESDRAGNPRDIWVMNADGGAPIQLTHAAEFDGEQGPDWQPLPVAPPAGTCGDTVLQLNRATVEGNLEETAAGSGVFRAGPGDKVFVGGFELLPRIGGELLVDTNTNSLSEGGDGVSVFFGIFPVPLDVDSLPTNLPEATLMLNRDGTLLKTLFSLPIAGSLKVAWAEGGKATALEFELEAEKLVGDFGSFSDAGLQAPSLKITAKQANCTGFEFTGAEVKADEISFVPTKLKVKKKLGLRNFLFKYEEQNGVPFWTGQGELILPTGKGSLSVGGKATIAGTKLGGVGLSVGGINRSIGYGLFLQSVAGELVFEPDFGFNFGVGATLGPELEGKKLVKLGGNFKGLAQATECTNGDDPVAFVATGSIPLVEEHQAGSVKIEGVNCIYTDSLAIEQSPKVEAVFGEVVNGEVPRPAALVKANLTGFVGADHFIAEGGGSITIPAIGAVRGQVSVSDLGLAACGGVGFFSGGIGHRWGQGTTDVFTGCDVAAWRADAANQSVFSPELDPIGFSSARIETVRVRMGLPFAGFSARGAKRPPRVRVTGPNGESFTSRDGRAVVRRNVVMVPSAIERRTFVFVKAPSAGRWTVEALRGGPITELRTANGLPKPKVVGEITGAGTTRTLSYLVKRIPGQQITFFERTSDGVAQEIGKATRASGRLAFTPASTGQAARIEAVVEQDGFPRETILVSRFSATTPTTAKPPRRPRRVRATRRGRGLVVKWSRVAAAARYRIDLFKGRRRVARRTIPATQLRLKRVPAARLRVEVRALSVAGTSSRPRVRKVAATGIGGK